MTKKISMAGNGIVALMSAYFIYLHARENNEQIRITMRGTHLVSETTSGYLFPSMTENEIQSVVPPGKKLIQSLGKPFKDFNGGIFVASPEGILDSAQEFLDAVQANIDETSYQRRTQLLTELSKYAISLWDSIYQTADSKLKNILEESNYLPHLPHQIK